MNGFDATQRVEKWYRGGALAEELFTVLGSVADRSPRQVAKCLRIADLERNLQAYLIRKLSDLNSPPPDTSDAREQGRRLAEEFAETSWGDLMAHFLPLLEQAAAGMEVDAADMPERVADIAEMLARHERAIARFMALEISADSAGSLEPIEQMNDQLAGVWTLADISKPDVCRS